MEKIPEPIKPKPVEAERPLLPSLSASDKDAGVWTEYTIRPLLHKDFTLPLAASSTGTIAGSAERIAVYRQRAANGESIFHPLDCKLIAVRQSHKST
jgi:hypothetical protein